MKEIPLRGIHGKGKFAIVDDDVLDNLPTKRWYVSYYGYPYYSKDRVNIFMHHVVMGCLSSERVDHINRNPLDNRKENLRHASNRQNLFNRGENENSTTGYKGVTQRVTKRGRGKLSIVAQIQSNGVNIYLGSFCNLHDAARAYNRKAKELFGEFAFINEVLDGKGNF